MRNGSIFVGIDLGKGRVDDWIEQLSHHLKRAIRLGSTPEHPGATTIQAGSVLDDYQWHDLAITRYLKNITIKIDQSVVNDESQSAFNGLDLDGKVKRQWMAVRSQHRNVSLQLYVGGAPNHMERGITVRPNFQGCLENVLYISPSTEAILDMLQNLQRQAPFYGLEQGMVGAGSMCEVCRRNRVWPCSMTSLTSSIYLYIRIPQKSETSDIFSFLLKK